MSDEIIKAYKGFDKNMQCRGFQYEEGKEYEEPEAEICERGFHSCELPMDVWHYYPPVDGNEFHKVEASGDVSKNDDEDSKICTSRIKIGAKISIAGIIKASIKIIKNKAVKQDKINSGNCGNAANSGYRGNAESNHPGAIAVAWGPESKAKGVKGSHIVLAEWESNGGNYWEESTWTLKGAKMIQIDGKKYKENTWYELVNGETKEVE